MAKHSLNLINEQTEFDLHEQPQPEIVVGECNYMLVIDCNDIEIIVDELGYTATLQRRQEQSNGAIASGASSKTINFDKNFFTGTGSLGGTNSYLPSIGINAMNLASGDYIEMGTVTGSSFVVTFKASNGSEVDRNFTWSAVGYGKAV